MINLIYIRAAILENTGVALPVERVLELLVEEGLVTPAQASNDALIFRGYGEFFEHDLATTSVEKAADYINLPPLRGRNNPHIRMLFMPADEVRLDRIEGKLDKLSEAINALARLEERTVTIFRRMDASETVSLQHAVTLRTLEETSAGRGQTMRLLERVWWIVFTASVGAALFYTKGSP